MSNNIDKRIRIGEEAIEDDKAMDLTIPELNVFRSRLENGEHIIDVLVDMYHFGVSAAKFD